jgi:hypothetical protein
MKYFAAALLVLTIALGTFAYVNHVSLNEMAAENATLRSNQTDLMLKVTELQADANTQRTQAPKQLDRAARAAACIKSAEEKAVSKFYVECVGNPDIGGSPEKCDTSDAQQVIGYIEIAKGKSFTLFEIAKQLTSDRATCAQLYGN